MATYTAEVLADTPVGYWRLGEPSGTSAADSSGNARTGTYIGSPGLNRRSLVPVANDPSVTFDGLNDYVDITGTATTLSASGRTALTVECWVRTSLTPLVERYLLAKPKSAFGAYELLFNPAVPGRPVFRVGKLAGHSPSNMAQLVAPASALINDAEPHYLVGVKDATTLLLYVDGLLVATQSDPEQLEDDNNFSVRIGALGPEFVGVEGYWDGTLDDVAIYFSALDSTRIAAHYLAGVGINLTQAGLANGWHSDQRAVLAGGGRY